VSQAPRLVERSMSAAVSRNPYWLLAKRRWGRLEVLTTSVADGRRVLPVFSFEEEANLYLRLGIRGSWQVRQTGGGELLSLLYCLCNKVELVALDPMSDVEIDVMDRLVSLKRERFMDVLLRRETSVRLSPDATQTTPALDGRRSISAQTKATASWNPGGED
jgi:hypothetical protein